MLEGAGGGAFPANTEMSRFHTVSRSMRQHRPRHRLLATTKGVSCWPKLILSICMLVVGCGSDEHSLL
jgi:hypothetical protein